MTRRVRARGCLTASHHARVSAQARDRAVVIVCACVVVVGTVVCVRADCALQG